MENPAGMTYVSLFAFRITSKLLLNQEQLRSKSFGLSAISSSGIAQIIAPIDLNLNIALPERRSLPTRLKALLGAAYDHFDQGSWRDGFEEASRVLEIQSRCYLKRWIKTSRIHTIDCKW